MFTLRGKLLAYSCWFIAAILFFFGVVSASDLGIGCPIAGIVSSAILVWYGKKAWESEVNSNRRY